MTTQQGLRQQSIRDVTGTALSYNGDWEALFDLFAVPLTGGFNGRMLAYVNTRLGTSYTNLPAALQALATDVGATNFSSIGTFVSGAAITLSANSIAENAANGTSIGTLSVVGGSGSYTFTIIDDPDNLFDISGGSAVKDGTLDYETAISHQVTIGADNGVDDPIQRTFTIYVTDVDDTAPLISSLSPADNATQIVVTSDLVATFNEAIQFGTGTIDLYSGESTLVESFDVVGDVGTGDGQVSIAGNVLTINPTASLSDATSYHVLIGAAAVEDLAGNPFAGISSATAWNFTTSDLNAPTVSVFSPADNAPGASVSGSPTVTFNEAVMLGATGTINLKKGSDNSLVESWDVATESGSTAGKVEASGSQLIMHLTANMAVSTDYYII